MSKILKLQKLELSTPEMVVIADSSGSSTCVGVSCTSNGCVPQEDPCGCSNN